MAVESAVFPAGFAALFSQSRSPLLRTALDRALKFAPADECILLEGESGTGKTNLAHHIHQVSLRRDGPYQRETLAALNDDIAASELFGHCRGAFTGAVRDRKGLVREADGGTLFLDEVGKASRAVQQRLLDLVDKKIVRPVGSNRSIHVDCRLISASNVALGTLVERNEFLPDLMHRLGILRITLPPLRERREDIADIVSWMVEDRVRRSPVRRPAPRLHPEFIALCEADPWPGNLRSLHGLVASVTLMGEDELTPDHFLAERPPSQTTTHSTAADARGDEDLRAQIALHGGNMTLAARALGLHRSTLYRRLRAL